MYGLIKFVNDNHVDNNLKENLVYMCMDTLGRL